MSPIPATFRRKRFGQFFSGLPLGRLLAGLVPVRQAKTIIDPMAGRGDLLAACIDLGATPGLMAGIEVEETAFRAAAERLPGATLIQGDAFATDTLDALPRLGFDLVVGNPPFVRYQEGAIAHLGLPGAADVRRNLRSGIGRFGHWDAGARGKFADMVDGYSGLADLAVPSCILSMLMVASEGHLALVLPQSWLARDYAAPIRAAIDALFDLRAIVEDADAAWFEEALVRTTLLVARRKGIAQPTARPAQPPVHVGLTAAASNGHSLVGNLFPDAQQPDLAFGAALMNPRRTQALARHGFASVSALAGVSRVDRRGEAPGCIPETLHAVIRAALGRTEAGLVALAEIGVEVGQGLRTGANDFFYVGSPGLDDRARVSDLFRGRLIEVPASAMYPAVRDQASGDRGGDFLRNAILDLRRLALPEDLARNGAATTRSMTEMPRGLADHVRAAAATPSGKPGREREIAKLSAVRTNVRAERLGRPARFWYQLPDFQPRHLPDVYLPRVNAGRPVARINADRAKLVDANFLTFRAPDGMPPMALAALLNSTWSWAQMELAGAVLGGGALKLEATMFRRLAFPSLDAIALDAIGRGSDADEVILGALGAKGAQDALRSLCETRLAGRAPRSRREGASG